MNEMEIKKFSFVRPISLTRRHASEPGKYWFTVRWTEDLFFEDGSQTEDVKCFDSKIYSSYRECDHERSLYSKELSKELKRRELKFNVEMKKNKEGGIE